MKRVLGYPAVPHVMLGLRTRADAHVAQVFPLEAPPPHRGTEWEGGTFRGMEVGPEGLASKKCVRFHILKTIQIPGVYLC